ncbi:MAG: hypothetical protein JWR59_22, partial [Brevundimonas sp.]|nr:hypothetical protein [Brevundimonas sp.]
PYAGGVQAVGQGVGERAGADVPGDVAIELGGRQSQRIETPWNGAAGMVANEQKRR